MNDIDKLNERVTKLERQRVTQDYIKTTQDIMKLAWEQEASSADRERLLKRRKELLINRATEDFLYATSQARSTRLVSAADAREKYHKAIERINNLP